MIVTGANNFVSLSAKSLDGALQDVLLDMAEKETGEQYEPRGPMQAGKRMQNRIMKLDYLTLLRQVSLNVKLVLGLQGCT